MGARGRPYRFKARRPAAPARPEALEPRALLCGAHGWPDLPAASTLLSAAAPAAVIDDHDHDHNADAYKESIARGDPAPAEFQQITPMPSSSDAAFPAAVGDQLLPDMIPLASQADGYVYGWTIDTAEPTQPGRTLLRLSTAMANQGRGAMELRGSTANPDGSQNVLQRIYLEGGGSTDRLAGTFTYHPGHGHIHFDDFASYHLRTVTAGNGVGDVIASGDKVSFCLLDIDHFAPALPGSPAAGAYNSCGQVQGVSVGWADVYDQNLLDQWIDITDVAAGRYWLEVNADPRNRLLESDETNNVVRIQIDLVPPTPFPQVVTHRPTDTSVAPVGFVEIDFDEPMNTSSFDRVADVVSFIGPRGDDLRGQVTGHVWADNNTLRLTFATQTAVGTYTLTVGPNILAADNGGAMDQDGDRTAGESPDDRYTAAFTIDPCPGPDGFGYEACATPFENIDLAPGAAGVFDVRDNTDDGTAAINLGANTFNFYGTSYTGAASLFTSPNGLLTFGSASGAYTNGDLSDSPAQRAVAALWDDWRTDVDGNDRVLGKLEDTTGDGRADRLIVEWSQVRHVGSAPSPVTFQAILQLNTAAIPGQITLNYVDLDAGDANSNGGSSTVGLKDVGVQGANRLLVGRNNAANPLVGSGKAIRIAWRPAVRGRHVFYGNSAFDGNNPGAAAADDGAIATDKRALLPGGTATFANYTSYSKGLNGVMIDMTGLAPDAALSAADDFDFHAGNDDSPGDWPAAPDPLLTLRRGAGVNNSDRITLTWPDNTIRRTWLRVTMKSTAATGLIAPDVFYFGNAPGESGNWATAALVNSVDEAGARHHPRGALNTAPPTFKWDYNRDGRVNRTDQLIARAGRTTAETSLRLITPGSTQPALTSLNLFGVGRIVAARDRDESGTAAPPIV